VKREDGGEIEPEKDELREYIGQIERQQSNILWPDSLHNSRGVDELLWKGKKDAPLIQRAGIAVFALLFLTVGAAILLQAIDERSIIEGAFGGFSILLAIWLFRNALRGLRRKV
jgi:hypothetical protein